MSLSQGARKETQESSNRDPASPSVREAQEPTRGRNALKYIGVQIISYREHLNSDEKRAKRERDKAVDKRALERDAADRRGCHSPEEDELPGGVQGLREHELVQCR
jgi:hypothetical protein